MRNAAIAVIEADVALFQPYFELLPAETVADYLARIRQDGEWGDLAMLLAAGVAYGRDLMVVMPHGVDDYRPENLGFAPSPSSFPLWVARHAAHFESVRAVDEQWGPTAIPPEAEADVTALLR